jgi:hypothetical protein
MLVGDSQVLGYGVDWSQTLAPSLERTLGAGWRVVAAAVPSWGPIEYALAVEELAPRYRPDVVVFVANAANDWFEASVPNTVRTTAQDGWAARVVPGSPAPPQFPLRGWLLGESHLVLAARQLAGYLGGSDTVSATSARQLLTDLPQLTATRDRHRSRLTDSVLRAKDACARVGCTVVVAALPVDVQVHPVEWRKYRARPVDLRPTETLLGDLIADARALGLEAIDLLPVLRDVEPGAFLPDDYHLSPRGHAAAAVALARTIALRGAEVRR